MNATPRKRIRNPVETRKAILEASSTLFAQQGADSVSVSAVANLAGINRGTAYQHFPSREELIDATIQHISDQLFREVFGDPAQLEPRDVEKVDTPEMMRRLCTFAMDNADLCRSWLLQILATPDPASDPFWREFQGSLQRFADTDLSEDDIDSESMSVLILSGIFLWPVWARAHAKSEEERRLLALRFSREILRLSLYGSMREDKFPDIVTMLSEPVEAAEIADLADRR